MDNFHEKLFSLNHKLAEMTPKNKPKNNQLSILIETFSHEKGQSEKLIKNWESKIVQYEQCIQEFCLQLYNIEVERDQKKENQQQKIEDYIDELKLDHQRMLRESQKEISQIYCNASQLMAKEAKQAKSSLKEMRETIDKEIKSIKKILNQTNLTIDYDKNYYKKLNKIQENQEKIKQKLQQLQKKVTNRLHEIEGKFNARMDNTKRCHRQKDEKSKRILSLLIQLL